MIILDISGPVAEKLRTETLRRKEPQFTPVATALLDLAIPDDGDRAKLVEAIRFLMESESVESLPSHAHRSLLRVMSFAGKFVDDGIPIGLPAQEPPVLPSELAPDGYEPPARAGVKDHEDSEDAGDSLPTHLAEEPWRPDAQPALD